MHTEYHNVIHFHMVVDKHYNDYKTGFLCSLLYYDTCIVTHTDLPPFLKLASKIVIMRYQSSSYIYIQLLNKKLISINNYSIIGIEPSHEIHDKES